MKIILSKLFIEAVNFNSYIDYAITNFRKFRSICDRPRISFRGYLLINPFPA